ncbi:MAG: MarR family transcriptional regulator [Herbiconiux sp.]|uniref:MarR family winged helix-turn-helix transcriptional regulator n=1 Tax=Herbiconiux sp. TaxID=1871186 RepID=UPI001217BE3D|nr:MarR family transcriptional regulator [Herbiconiux sp.]TAJ49790.1 MAG: MarR family transcriptional regulator [Herbiconiux sp.]
MSEQAPLDRAQFGVWADFVLGYTRVMHEVEKGLRATTGLTWAQYDVLYNLNAQNDGLSVGDLSRTLLYSSGSASNLIRGMVTAGLVERSRSQSDGRVALISVTREGIRLFDRATALVLQTVRDEFAVELVADEMPAVAAFLSRLRARDPNLRRPPYDLPAGLL